MSRNETIWGHLGLKYVFLFQKMLNYFLGKIGDWESLLGLYADSDQWEEAFALANRNPDLSTICWTKRAEWLAERDMFIEAQQAFHQAGKTEDALTVLEKLTSCAVMGQYFSIASQADFVTFYGVS